MREASRLTAVSDLSCRSCIRTFGQPMQYPPAHCLIQHLRRTCFAGVKIANIPLAAKSNNGKPRAIPFGTSAATVMWLQIHTNMEKIRAKFADYWNSARKLCVAVKDWQ